MGEQVRTGNRIAAGAKATNADNAHGLLPRTRQT
jgi:hypothetical protein